MKLGKRFRDENHYRYLLSRGNEMEKTPFAPFLVGTVVMQSNLEIEEVGDILSQALFGGGKTWR